MSSVPDEDFILDPLQLRKGALTLRAINHKLRQQILQIIHKSGDITVTELFIKLRLEQSVASQHLAILRKAGLVNTQRKGKFIFYSINHERLKQIHEKVDELLAGKKAEF